MPRDRSCCLAFLFFLLMRRSNLLECLQVCSCHFLWLPLGSSPHARFQNAAATSKQARTRSASPSGSSCGVCWGRTTASEPLKARRARRTASRPPHGVPLAKLPSDWSKHSGDLHDVRPPRGGRSAPASTPKAQVAKPETLPTTGSSQALQAKPSGKPRQVRAQALLPQNDFQISRDPEILLSAAAATVALAPQSLWEAL